MEYLDDEGYPTNECLEYLSDHDNFSSPHEIIDLLDEIWWMPDWGITRKGAHTDKFKRRVFTYYISTGGWSGNESIINALKKNFMFWHYWRESRAGGHYKFRFPVKQTPSTA